MHTIPSDEVAKNIIAKLTENNVIEKTLMDHMERNTDNVYAIAHNLGILSLYTLKLEEAVRDIEADLVIPLSEYAIPFATILSWEYGLQLCTPLFGKKIRDPRVKILWYYSQEDKEIDFIVIPKMCVDKGSGIVLSDIVLNSADKLRTAVHMLNTNDSTVKGVITFYITKDCLKLLQELEIPFVHYIAVI